MFTVVEGLLRLRDELSPALSVASRNTQQFGQQMQQAGAGLLPLAAGITAVGVGSVKMATDLNKSLANVSAIMTNVADKDIGKVTDSMKTKVQAMALDMGKSTTDISGGLYEVISSLGYTNDTFGQLEISAKAGAAGLATTQQSFQFLSSVTKTYGDTSETAFKKVADLGFQAVNIGQTTFPELASSIGGVAPIAKVAGVSLEEMFAIMATATGVTGNTSEVVTQTTSAINSLLNPSTDMKKVFKEIGVTSGEAAIKQLGLVGSLQKVAEYSKRTSTPMLELVGRKEAFILSASLAGAQATTFSKNLNEMGEAAKKNGGVVEEAHKRQTEGINKAGFAWEQFKIKMEIAGQKLGDQLIPVLLKLATVLEPVLDWALKGVDLFGKLPAPIQLLVVAIGALIPIGASVLITLGGLVSAFGALGVSIGSVTAALGPATAAVAAFAASYALTTWFVENTEAGKALVDVISKVILGNAQMLGLVDLSGKGAKANEATAGFTVHDFATVKEWEAAMKRAQEAAAAKRAEMAKLNPTIKEHSDKTKESAGQTKQHAQLTDEQKKALEAARKAFEASVKSYQTANTEAGKAAAVQQQLKIIHAALGDISKASATDMLAAVKSLTAMGSAGAEAGRKLKQEWEAAHKVTMLVARDFGKLGEPLKQFTAGSKDYGDVQAEVAARVAELNAAQLEAQRVQQELWNLRKSGVITEQQYIDLGGQVVQKTQEQTEKVNKFAASLAILADVFQILGVKADSGIGKMVAGLQAGLALGAEVKKTMTGPDGQGIQFMDLSHAAKAQVAMAGLTTAVTAYKSGVMGGAMAGAAFGASFGPIGAGIGAVAGGLLGFLGGANKAKEEMRKLREEFLQSVGGMAALQQKAREAGVDLNDLFKAKNAKDLRKAIDNIKDGLDTWNEAQEKTNAALEEYGFTIDEMGPRMAQQRMEEMAGTLLEKWQLLHAAGVDHNAIIARMGPDFNEYVNTAIKGGQAIPESMRAIIEEMIKNKTLVDENGVAYESAEQAGIKWTTSMSDQFKMTLEAINKLVEAISKLSGINVPPIHVPVIPTYPQGVPGQGGGPHHVPENTDPLPEFAGGGTFRGPSSGALAMLHGTEHIFTPQQFQQMVDAAVTVGQMQGGAAGGDITVHHNFMVDQYVLGTAVTTIARRRQTGVCLGMRS
jgi:TP901 family phage tail tape measure protein